jgi:hypothetical protein
MSGRTFNMGDKARFKTEHLLYAPSPSHNLGQNQATGWLVQMASHATSGSGPLIGLVLTVTNLRSRGDEYIA